MRSARCATEVLAVAFLGSCLAGCGVVNPPPAPRLKGLDSKSPSSSNPADNAFPVPDAIVEQWAGLVPDAEKVQDKPASAVLVEPEAFEKLWHSWRGNEKPPKVDFAFHLVLVAASREVTYAGLAFNGHDVKGDIKLCTTVHSSLPKKAFSYVIKIVKPDGIKSVDGRPILAK
jgi:hypothetical protein